MRLPLLALAVTVAALALACWAKAAPLVSADPLYGTAVVQAVRSGRTVALAGPAAPYYVPDLAAVAVTSLVTSDPWQQILAGWVTVVMLMAGGLTCLLRWGGGVPSPQAATAGLAGTATWLTATTWLRVEPAAQAMVLPICHNGALVCCVWLAAVAARCTVRPSRPLLAFLAGLVAVTVASDALVLAHGVAPLLAVLAWRRDWRTCGALLAGLAGSKLLTAALALGGIVASPSPASGGHGYDAALRLLAHWPVLRADAWAWALAALVLALWAGGRRYAAPTWRYLGDAAALSAVAAVAAPMAAGLWQDVGHVRYMLPWFAWPAVAAGILLAQRPSGVLAVVAVGLTVAMPLLREVPMCAPYPAAVQAIDASGATSGVGEYWLARYAGACSRRGVDIRQLDGGLQPLLMPGAVPDWHGYRPQFVVVTGLDRELVLREFGRPSRRGVCPWFGAAAYRGESVEVWWYDVPPPMPWTATSVRRQRRMLGLPQLSRIP
jgi:hypothetical protein